ncbi:MAG: right-handed parallel beta-helix repeat-containing protein [Candidatus Babeliales bacterium]
MKRLLIILMLSVSSVMPLEAFLMQMVDGEYIPVPPNGVMRLGASGVNIPSGGFTIASPGKFIIDSAQPTAFAAGVTPITITASDVELNMNGFTLTGPGTDTGAGSAGIRVDTVVNVVISNGTLELIDGVGIELIDCTSVRIEDMLCRANATHGFSIIVAGNEHCSILNCRAESNGQDGFFDAGGSSITYKSCTSYANGGSGYDLNANNHVVEDCVGNENDIFGMSVTGTSSDIIQSHFDENSDSGVNFQSISDFCLQDCTMNRNVGSGLVLNNAVSGSVTRCCITGNEESGVIGLNGTNNISIFNNSVIGNVDKGITLDVSTTQSCQIISNRVVNNGNGQGNDAFGIDIGGGPHQSSAVKNSSFTLVATTHEVFSNFAKNNGNNPAVFASKVYTPGMDIGDTNYSNNVNQSPETGPQPNGLVTTVASSAGTFQNITT